MLRTRRETLRCGEIHRAPLPASPRRTRLLAHAWMRYGTIDPHEIPGPLLHNWRI